MKICRTCDTVIAGVFPPEPPPLQAQEPQRHQRQRHVVMPADPAAHLVMIQPRLAVARLEELLDPVPLPLGADQLGQGDLRPPRCSRRSRSATRPPTASPPAAPPARSGRPAWPGPGPSSRRPPAAPSRRRGPSAAPTATPAGSSPRRRPARTAPRACGRRPARLRGGRRRSRSRTVVLQGTSST